mmetsp:Transcript_67642/g.161387  ORF Transcript_67642/g.161387 Transcript_67642/m.161387 type:complete len:227 (-) Transcript_67642:3879-4559(-)
MWHRSGRGAPLHLLRVGRVDGLQRLLRRGLAGSPPTIRAACRGVGQAMHRRTAQDAAVQRREVSWVGRLCHGRMELVGRICVRGQEPKVPRTFGTATGHRGRPLQLRRVGDRSMPRVEAAVDGLASGVHLDRLDRLGCLLGHLRGPAIAESSGGRKLPEQLLHQGGGDFGGAWPVRSRHVRDFRTLRVGAVEQMEPLHAGLRRRPHNSRKVDERNELRRPVQGRPW